MNKFNVCNICNFKKVYLPVSSCEKDLNEQISVEITWT